VPKKSTVLADGNEFSTLVEGLGGWLKILDANYYKQSHASLCIVCCPRWAVARIGDTPP
jgi:hypothetical protein